MCLTGVDLSFCPRFLDQRIMAGQKAVCVLLESKSKEVKGVINFEQVMEGMLR